jgi:hypothetical protein
VNRSLGVWGIFPPGLCQVVTGVLLFVGMTWLQVFSDPALHMAALAFSAYGIHWFALGWNRYPGNDPRPNAGMSVAFTVISVLGAFVFFDAGVWAVGVLFVGLTCLYVVDFFVSVGMAAAERALGLAHVLTGLWLMYLMVGTTLNIASGFHLPASRPGRCRARSGRRFSPRSPSGLRKLSDPRHRLIPCWRPVGSGWR